MSPENPLDAEDEAEVLRIRKWAKGEPDVRRLANLLDEVEERRKNLSPAHSRALKQMQRAFFELFAGHMPHETWTLQLCLEANYGDSRGTRTYSLMLDSDGVRAECHGTEWSKEIGSDSWSGPEFFYSPIESRSEGDIFALLGEFDEAIRHTEEYELNILRDDDPVGDGDEDPSSMGKGAIAPAESYPTHCRRVVILDDEFIARAAHTHFLLAGWPGVKISEFEEGDAAWQELSRASPDLLITDINHPGMTCEDMLNELVERRAKYTILVISGYPPRRKELQHKFQASFNVTFMGKPPNWAECRNVVETALQDFTGPTA